MTNLMNKLFIALIIISPALHAFDHQEFLKNIAIAKRKEEKRQMRIRRAQDFVERGGATREVYEHGLEHVQAPSLQFIAAAACVAVAGFCLILSQIHSNNEK